MASAGAVTSGFRQHLLRPSSHCFLYSFPVNHRQRLRSLSLLSSLFFAPLTSRRPPAPCPLSPPESRFPLTQLGYQRLFSVSVADGPVSPSLDAYNEEDEETQWIDDEFDAASNDDVEEGDEEEDDEEKGEGLEVRVQALDLPKYPSPVLSVKEKKELASYAHSLGKKLKSQQVGKSGVTASLISAFTDALEANELLKLKVHGNCPGELPDVIRLLEASTGSVAVGRIGRSVILYRPSISKMQQAQEKRPVRSPRRPGSFNGPFSRPSGQRDQTRKPFLRKSSRKPAKV